MPYPRALVLRKDGVLFIGPDNGSLTLACPQESILGIWEINSTALNALTGIDFPAGGTFHGRDLFCEAAFRIAAGATSLQETGIAYPQTQLRNKIDPRELETVDVGDEPISFETIQTDRAALQLDIGSQNQLFEKTFILGVIQSLLYPKEENSLTNSKKLYIVNSHSEDECVAVVNNKTGNIFIGPNNGLGTAFFKDYKKNDCEVFRLSDSILKEIETEKNNEKACLLIKQQPAFDGDLQEIEFLGGEKALIRDDEGRPERIQGLTWIDNYGNIKTTLQSSILNEVRKNGGHVSVKLNDVARDVIFADTFSQVPDGELFIYNGSSGVVGDNPHRSKRYVEITANGIFGKFGIDYFVKEGKKPESGALISFAFTYN